MERGCKRQTSIRVSHQNTSVTLAISDDRGTKENKDCDNTTRVKIEPEVLDIYYLIQEI